MVFARLVFVTALVASALAVPGVARAGNSVDTPPSCLDLRDGQLKQATKWLTAPGKLVGTSGPDVLVGSGGPDIILGRGGDDIICSAPMTGNFLVDADGGEVDAGPGVDYVFAFGDVRGGSGPDDLIGVLGTVDGGSGSDRVEAQLGAIGSGGSGNDELYSYDADQLAGGSGNDTIRNVNGNPKIDCGSGVDAVSANGATNVRRCESTI